MNRSRTRSNTLSRRPLRKPRVLLVLVVAGLLLSWTFPRSVHAAAGELDTAFGTGGKVTTDAGKSEGAEAIAIQSDGKIVVAGTAEMREHDFGVVRYKSDGSLDTGFGLGGMNGLDFFGGHDMAHALAIGSDGKIVLAGEVFNTATNNTDFGLGRFNTDGSVDGPFGAVTTDFFGLADRAMAVALLPDGKILAVGFANNGPAGKSYDFALARYNPDGSLDTSFGTNGKVTTDFLNSTDWAYAAAIQPDGKIVAAGYMSGNFALARYNSDGSLDSSFGNGGKVNSDFFGREDYAYGVTLQPDGKIVAAGYASNASGTSSDLAVARYTANGGLDVSFGTNGRVTTDFFGDLEGAFDVAIQPDGRILAAGFARVSNGSDDPDFALARYNAEGSLDSSFGSGGKVTTDFFGREDLAFAMALTPGGRIVLAGSARTPASEDIALACYLMGEVNAPDFSLGFSQPTVNAVRGTKVRVTVNINRSGGFTGGVTVSPPDPSADGIVPKFPEPITTSGSTAAWKFKIKGFASPGPHQLTFTGRDDTGRVRTGAVTLLVD